MCRFILLFFLMAISMPHLLEAVKQCYDDYQQEDFDGKNYKPKDCILSDKCHINYDCLQNGRGCDGCLPKSFGCKCFECETDLCNGDNGTYNGGPSAHDIVSRCYWGSRGKEIECLGYFKGACHKIECDFGPARKGCGKCSQVLNPGGCPCFECTDQDLCNDGMRSNGPSFLVLLAMIGGVVAFLALKPLMAIGIGI